MEKHPPYQTDDHRIHQQGAQQDGVVEGLETLNTIEHQGNGKPNDELDDHDRNSR